MQSQKKKKKDLVNNLIRERRGEQDLLGIAG